MVEVAPFKGITYNVEKIPFLDKVMSPPYDIISEKMQEQLYNNHPNNYVRLILGKIFSNDSEINNRYTRANKELETMLQKSILIQSDTPAIYPYLIEYMFKGQKKAMKGFFILLQLDRNYKQVKAHEKTLSKPKADRLNLIKTCRANLEPIQLLYIDELDNLQQVIKKELNEKPIISVKGYDSFQHSIWKITNKKIIAMVREQLHDKTLFIADGHHRYQTSINYANEMEKKSGITKKDAPYNYIMVILANMFDDGLTILPTHRLISLSIDREKVLRELSEYFTIKTFSRKQDKMNYKQLIEAIKKQLETTSQHQFAMVFRDAYYLLSLKNESVMDVFAQDKSKIWRTLDVSILHKIIIEHVLGVSPDALEDHVKYTRDDEEAIRFIDDGSFSFSFIMNATKIDELKAIAEAGEHMPQKSTYFLPKMLSGLVMYKMDF